jgi:hypothetical protein
VSASGHADLLFFLLTGHSRAGALGAQNLFFLTGRIHLAAGRADFFMGCPVRAEHLCQPAQQHFFGRICTALSARAARKKIVFLSGHFRAEVSGRQSAQKFVFFWPVRSPPRSSLFAQNYFFWAAQLFLLPSGLICAEPFDFLWRMESLQYTFSESCVRNLNCLAFSLCRFWLSDRTGQKQLNWPMGDG